jgi:putative PIN family toxin of toxin-antitoxin system
MMRAVVDTTILVSAVIKPSGRVGAVMQRLRRREYKLLISRATLDEFTQVIFRPHLRKKYGLTDRVLRSTIRLIVLRSELVHPGRRIAISRDPHDDKFLEVADSGNADVIVSGDEDLLTLTEFEGIPIIPPSRFLAMLEGAH